MTTPDSEAIVVELASRLATLDRDNDPALLGDEAAHRRACELNAVVLAAPDEHEDRVLRVLGHWFLLRYRLLRGADQHRELRWARLHAALLRGRHPAGLTERLRELLENPPDLDTRVTETVLGLLSSFDENGDPGQVAAARALLLDLCSWPGGSRAVDLLNAFAEVSRARYVIDADPKALRAMERAARDALARTTRGDPMRPILAATVAGALLLRADLGGDDAVGEAVTLMEQEADPSDPATPPIALSLLGNALRARFERTHRVADLDRAVDLCRRGHRAVRVGAPGRFALSEMLMTALMRRHHHLWQEADLEEAISVIRADEPPAALTGVIRASWLANLATLLTTRHVRNGSRSDLDEAIMRNREAISMSGPLTLLRLTLSGNHATNLALRHVETDDPADLDEAVDAARTAVDLVPAEGTMLATRLYVLASLLLRRPDPDHTREAAALLDKALPLLSAGHPQRAILLLTYGEALRRRYREDGDIADRAAATRVWWEAARLPVGRSQTRLRAAERWMSAALEDKNMPSAAAAMGEMVRLLPVLAWRGLDRGSRERGLATMSWVSGQAVALCVITGDLERAVELADRGRGVLWGQAVQIRADLSALRAVDPALADELDRTRATMDREDPLPATDLSGDERFVRERREAAERWDTLLGRARALPGFADFLGPVPFSRLREAAADGPVVIVNTHSQRCDALIVRCDGVTTVPLPWLTLAEAHSRADALLAATAQARSGDGPARAHLRHTLGSLLRWLWDVLAEPVLSELDHTEGEGRHRVWWCPTGPLTMLPLHAAGRYGNHHRDRPPTVPDRTVSSYATGLNSLLRARRPFTANPGLLAVGMPETPDHSPLPAVVNEITRIATLVPDTHALTGPHARPDTVLAALAHHGWAHFACHATQQADRPADSALHLAGGSLTILRLASQNLAGAELAYLSACGTAAGSPTLADETLSLAAAIQMAGYRHVIGTLWPIPDVPAAEAADLVYTALIASGRPDASAAATALTAATARLRAEHPNNPEIWAAFIHLGP